MRTVEALVGTLLKIWRWRTVGSRDWLDEIDRGVAQDCISGNGERLVATSDDKQVWTLSSSPPAAVVLQCKSHGSGLASCQSVIEVLELMAVCIKLGGPPSIYRIFHRLPGKYSSRAPRWYEGSRVSE